MRPEKKEALTRFHREQILLAAEKCFGEKGVEGTTMDDIARLADYSKATLYVYFKNKDEIVSALILRGMRLLRDNVHEAVLLEQNWTETYYAVCNAVARFYFERPMAYEVTAGAINVDLEAPDTPYIFQEIYDTGETINRELADFLQRGTQAGVIAPQSAPLQTVFILWAAISGIVRMANQKADYLGRCLSISKEEFLQESFALLLRALQKGEQDK